MPTFANSAALRWMSCALIAAITTLAAVQPADARKSNKGLKAITLSPAKIEGIAGKNVRLPVFSVRNTTGKDYKTTVFASFLRQDRAGGVMVETNPARIKLAGKLVRVSTSSFNFPNGGKGGTLAGLIKPDVDHNFYGTVTFSSLPVSKKKDQAGATIKQGLEISSSLFMRPTPALTRVGFKSQPCFVRQLKKGQIGYFAPVRNTGNIHSKMTGNAVVTNLATGKKVSRKNPIQSLNQLPTFIVDHKATERGKVPAGSYRVDMKVSGRNKTVSSTCQMRLVGINTLSAADAELVDFDTPKAYFGHDVDISGSYRNSGNIAFTPKAVLEVKDTAGANNGKVIKTYQLNTSATKPGEKASIDGVVAALPDKGNYEFTMRLVDDRGFELDSRTIAINQNKAPAWWEALLDFLRAHMILIMGAMAGLMALLFIFLLWRRRKRKKDEKTSDISYRMERAVMQQRMAQMEAQMQAEALLRQQMGAAGPPEAQDGYSVEDAEEETPEGPGAA
jgi:hypothetical protein